ncbi:pyridoxal phosphate-dependent transferase [Blakeslea trispora]|nr:pyridoxal phosphate-dependent transferase [Blakeslea trispora]
MVFISRTIPNENQPNEGDPYFETTVYGTTWAAKDIPKYQLPEEEMPANVAYRMITDELTLDGTPALNLASFVTTFMEDEATRLMTENIAKNFIDFEEYPQSAEISNRCVNIIAHLFNAPQSGPGYEAVGCSTVGSSEAIILATLAMKRRWQMARKRKGLPTDQPNFIMGTNCHVAWHKAMRYLEIEGREVPCTEELLYMDPKKAVDLVDENTIGICVILGSTYTGHYEDAKSTNMLLDAKCKEKGYDVGIHIDAASGGFIAPFVTPDLEWDFRLNRVHSINVSGHKYGLTYPGIGWAIWRNKEYLPEDLVFNINYLGSDQASFTFNFSKGASNIIAQYYILIRLGRSGFTHVMKNLVMTANHLAQKLEDTGRFKILSDRTGKGVPLVAFCLKERKEFYDEFDLSAKLRERGWIVPAYTMAPNMQHLKLARVVIREDFTRNRCELLIRDISYALQALDKWEQKEADNHRHDRRTSARHNHRASLGSTKEHYGTTGAEEDEEHKKREAPGVC